MQQPSNPFNLPMMLTFLESRNGHLVHSLDFDIVSVATTEHEAWEKARLCGKGYVEFGLSKGWPDYIAFSAPQDKITPDTNSCVQNRS
jgi:hypothetical protein